MEQSLLLRKVDEISGMGRVRAVGKMMMEKGILTKKPSEIQTKYIFRIQQ